MKFEEILVHLRECKKVTRKIWDNPIHFNEWADLSYIDSEEGYVLTGEDINADDWELYKEEDPISLTIMVSKLNNLVIDHIDRLNRIEDGMSDIRVSLNMTRERIDFLERLKAGD